MSGTCESPKYWNESASSEQRTEEVGKQERFLPTYVDGLCGPRKSES